MTTVKNIFHNQDVLVRDAFPGIHQESDFASLISILSIAGDCDEVYDVGYSQFSCQVCQEKYRTLQYSYDYQRLCNIFVVSIDLCGEFIDSASDCICIDQNSSEIFCQWRYG